MSDNASGKIYPASTVKLMTAIVIAEQIEKKHIKIGRRVTITSDMLDQVPHGLSVYGLKKGNTYTLNTLLHMSLIVSAGDAMICSGIAVFGSTQRCINAMNAKCKSMGLSHTKFDNLVGLDIGDNYDSTYSTALEIAKITQYAMTIPLIRQCVAKKSYTVKQTNGRTERTLASTNYFYSKISYPKDKYQVIGAKSGTTNAAGYVFTAVATDKSNREVICTYMGKYSKTATFEDIRSIFNVVYEPKQAKKSTTPLKKGNLKLVVKDNYSFEYSSGSKAEIAVKVKDNKTKKVVKKNIGKITFASNNKNVVTVNQDGVGYAKITITVKESKSYHSITKKVHIEVVPSVVEGIESYYSEDGIKLMWDEVEEASGYYIYKKSEEESEWTKVATTEETDFEDYECEHGEVYQYIVAAFTKADEKLIEGMSSEPFLIQYFNPRGPYVLWENDCCMNTNKIV